MKIMMARPLCLAALLMPAAAMAQSSPSDFTSATRYDLDHRVVATIAPDPDGAGALHHLAVRNTYDTAGRLVKVEKGELADWQSENVAPKNWESFTTFSIQQTADTEYDLLDRKVKDSLSSGGTVYQVTQYSYDAVGRLQCTAVRMNPAGFASLPSSACTLGTEGSQGPDRITKNLYDDAGQLVQVRKALGTGIEQAYVTYGYTANGKQEYVVDANGNKARLVYDGHDRQAQWQFPSATLPTAFSPSTPANALATAGSVNTGDYEAYDYDANGNRTSARKRDGRTFGFTYDNLDRMTVKAVPDACVSGYACTNVASAATRDVYYSYDAWGRQTAARFDSASGADAVTSGYDGFGRQTSSATSMGGASRTLSYLYDADGNRTRVTHPDGNFANYYREGLGRIYYADLNGAAPLFYPPHDSAGRVVALYRWVASNWGIVSSYGYDGISRPTSIASAFPSVGYNTTSTFAYNPASQITTRTRDTNAYAFTGYVGVSRSYAANGLNQYSSAGGVSFGYDSNGNLTASGATSYTYDAENRVVVASTGANLVYDPLGRLYETNTFGSGVTRFLYDGDELVAEYDASGTMLRRYVHGSRDDDPLVWYEGAGVSSPRYLFSDHQGSVVAISDASGNVTRINTYDEYGIPGAGNSVNIAGRFQYTGQAWIPELGMYHYKARIYSPTLGRFMQTDPVGYVDQINLYTYASNDPINRLDPTGERSYLVSRPLMSAAGGRGGPQRTPVGHMFVIIVDDSTGKITNRFTYGPSTPNGGSLVSLTGSGTSTDLTDAKAAQDFLVRPDAAAHWGIVGVAIDAPDEAVRQQGLATNEVLGTAQNPGPVDYELVPTPDTKPNNANSNSAAYKVAQGAVSSQRSGRQPLPRNTRNPGWGQWDRIPARRRFR